MRRVGLVLLCLALAACAGVRERRAAPLPPDVPFEWALEAAPGFDAFNDYLESNQTSCTAVVRDGVLIHEGYWNGGAEDRSLAVFSVTKSFTAVMIGIAADDGDLSLDDRVSQYVPDWRGTASEAVTIRQVLSNTSGRAWSFETDYEQMAFRARDKTEFSVALGQDHEPGTEWRYNNAAIQVLAAVILEATGRDAGTFARERLLGPLGMADSRWGSDKSGRATTFAGLTSTCRDLARFGQLLLDRGEWQGERIVSEEFLDDAVGRSSSELNAAYGLLFWINRPGTVLGPLTATGAKDQAPYEGSLAPDLPDDTFWALGFGNQIVAVVPEDRLVAIRIGARPTDESALTPGRFTGEVVDAAEKSSAETAS